MAYMGFKKLKEKIAQGTAGNPGAVAAAVARKKYGAKALKAHAAKGTSMEHTKHKKVYG